jgi:site-specific recombinase XerD
MTHPVQIVRPSSRESVLASFEERLTACAYKPATRKMYVRICQQFQTYLEDHHIGLGAVDELHVEAFVRSVPCRRRVLKADGAIRRKAWRRPAQMFVEEVRRTGLAPRPASPSPPTPPCQQILDDFALFVATHRGLAKVTIDEYCRWLGRLLEQTGIQTTEALSELSVAQIDRFLIDASRGRIRSTVQRTSSAVRVFLRYAHIRGWLDVDLSPHVAMPGIYSMERLPRFVDWGDVERTLASPDRTTLIGSRDYALLVLLALCGLRGGEVAALRLDDVDWRHDLIRLRRPKSDTFEPVPLVPVVGEALLDYVRRRPATPLPHLFVKVLAPIGPMTRANIGQVVKVHLTRAGVKATHWGCHTLRHSQATYLLQQGVPLKTIGEVLGHHHPESTFIYAKTAVADLREVCLDITAVRP